MVSLYKMAALLISTYMVTVSCFSMEHHSKRSMTRWCGPSLVQALHLICNGNYQKMFKKSTLYDFEAPGEDLSVVENVPLIDELPLFSLLMAQHPMEMDMAKSGVRVRRGVSDECCHKGCTLAVLSSYCAE